MSKVRCIIVVKKTEEKKIVTDLKKSFKYQKLGENINYSLFVFEGADIPVFKVDYDDNYVAGVDGRNPTFYKAGNEELAYEFNVSINLAFGLSINLSRKNKLPSQAKPIMLKLESLSNEKEEDDAEDRYNIRFDVPPEDWLDPLPKDKSPIKLIQELSLIFKKAKFPFRATFFNGTNGDINGELSDAGLFVGPSAYIFCKFVQNKSNKQESDLVINDSEILINGDSLEGFN
jgi:hypothetical protein